MAIVLIEHIIANTTNDNSPSRFNYRYVPWTARSPCSFHRRVFLRFRINAHPTWIGDFGPAIRSQNRTIVGAGNSLHSAGVPATSTAFRCLVGRWTGCFSEDSGALFVLTRLCWIHWSVSSQHESRWLLMLGMDCIVSCFKVEWNSDSGICKQSLVSAVMNVQ